MATLSLPIMIKTGKQKNRLKKPPRYTPATQALRNEIQALTKLINTSTIPMSWEELWDILNTIPKQMVGNGTMYHFPREEAKRIVTTLNFENRHIDIIKATGHCRDVENGRWQEKNPKPVIFNERMGDDGKLEVRLEEGGHRMITAALRGPLWLFVSIGPFYSKEEQQKVRTAMRISKPAGAADRAQVCTELSEDGEKRSTILESVVKLYLRPSTVKVKDNGMTAMELEDEITRRRDVLERSVKHIQQYFERGSLTAQTYTSKGVVPFTSAYMLASDENPSLVDEFFDLLFLGGESEMRPQQIGTEIKPRQHPVLELRKKLGTSMKATGEHIRFRRPHFLQSFTLQAFRWYVEYKLSGIYPNKYFSNSLFIYGSENDEVRF